LARGEVLDRQVEAAALAAYEYESLAVGQMPRRNVVVAFERHALDAAVAEVVAVDLRTASAIRGEQDRSAVGREIGFGVDSRRGDDPLHAAAVGIDEVDVRAAVARERHGELASVRGPVRRAVAAAEVG